MPPLKHDRIGLAQQLAGGLLTAALVLAPTLIVLDPITASATGSNKPTYTGTLTLSGTVQDGSTLTASGLTWHAPSGTVEMMVHYTFYSCSGSTCKPANRVQIYLPTYIPSGADVGRTIKVTVTAVAVLNDASNTHTQTAVSYTTPGSVAAYPAGLPQSEFVNGVPEAHTTSVREHFQVGRPHGNPASGALTQQYQVDTRGWVPLPSSRVFDTGVLAVGNHTVTVKTTNTVGPSSTTMSWTVDPMPAPVGCGGCWKPPHLDGLGKPMRWDWQIGAASLLMRNAGNGGAVDIYDVDGFNTAASTVSAIKTSWVAATLPHPRTLCYIDLGSWEDFRADGALFPPQTLGNALNGFPNERWIDVRQLGALQPVIDARLRNQCAAKGFDGVEVDNIDGFDPSTTTGFQLTEQDGQAFLAYIYNKIHSLGMAAIWKNEPYATAWGHAYTDGAIVEQCYEFTECFASQNAGLTPLPGVTCTLLSGSTPCGWDDFTSTGQWVGEAEYSFVCDPGKICPANRKFTSFCQATYQPPPPNFGNGFSAVKFDINLDSQTFFPCS